MKRQERRRLEAEIRRIASGMMAFAKTWEFDGTPSTNNMRCISLSRRVHIASGAVVIFTRDSGHHTSGWMKNPDYERCWHLYLSPITSSLVPSGLVVPPSGLVVPPQYITREMDKEITRMWCEAFFGEHLRLAWGESPKSAAGKQAGVWHWRVFADENWEPILPRGEVYSTDFTEKGWKSASEIFELTGKPEPISTVDPS